MCGIAMMTTITTSIGLIAAVCTTIAFIPQAIKIIRTRDSSSISVSMYLIFSFGVGMWLVYGVLTWNIPIIFANTVTFALCCFILFIVVFRSKK